MSRISTVYTTLFVRSKGGVALTASGTMFLEYAQQQNTHWRGLLARLHSENHVQTLRIGTHLMHMDPRNLQIMIRFQEIEPEVTVTFRDAEDYTAFWKMLRENQIDVARTRKAPESEDLRWIKLKDLRVFVLMAADHELAERKTIDFEHDLRGMTVLTVSSDTLLELSPHLKVFGIKGELLPPHKSLLSELIRTGKGVFPSPDFATSVIMTEGITAKELHNFPIKVGSYAVFRPNSPELVHRFIAYLEREA
jgi:DNA-binding transcriptional LysR family regulator